MTDLTYQQGRARQKDETGRSYQADWQTQRAGRQGWAGESDQAFMVGQGKVGSQAGNEDRGRQGRPCRSGRQTMQARQDRPVTEGRAGQDRQVGQAD